MSGSNQHRSRRVALLVVMGAGLALFALTVATRESSMLTWILLAASGFTAAYSLYLLLRSRRNPRNESSLS
ncbi:hypothetical protein [Mycolicibacterium austroafricanum]|uniref:hypothetical protein n=1 Tax=Mycolicibacterium austroafricanum TaxID=39687 RepID=UPI0011AE205E|nr:hypothetical protein [Mycolicibacterium austroafricanum]